MKTKPEFDAAPHRAAVEMMTAAGIKQADIAVAIGCTAKTLRKHFRHELDTGATRANTKVAASLFNKAVGDGPGAVAACIFWAKTRLGWRETDRLEHVGKDGGPIVSEQHLTNDIDLTALSEDELLQLQELTKKATDAPSRQSGDRG